MGRWADAFHTYIRTRDTVDSVDTTSLGRPLNRGSVRSVNSVTRSSDGDGGMPPPATEQVSPESIVSRAEEKTRHACPFWCDKECGCPSGLCFRMAARSR
jgi:hypothetical protein